MKIVIRRRSIDITDALRQLISRRLHFALDVFDERIRQASVYLADVNGPRGGVDKVCHITVAVRGISDVVVSDAGATAEAALTRATARLKYLVCDAVKQAQQPDNASIRRMGPAA
jgi:putative sigma-54 modulation protein